MAASTKKVHMSASIKDAQKGTGTNEEEEYMKQSKLLKEFINIPSIDRGWVFNSEAGSNISQAMFSITQPNLFANKKRMMLLSSNIRASGQSVNFQWSAFPVEMIGVSAIVPSPSGSKLLVVRNKDDGSPTLLEIWDRFMLQKEIRIPETVHGSLYTEQWFEGISWNKEENLVAYVAEEPSPPKPAFDDSGFKGQGIPDTVSHSWKGQGYWEEHWGETYSAKTKPSLYVVNIESGEVRAVDGIARSLSVGQVVWAPSLEGCPKHLVFVGWESENSIHHSSRKLGIKYCYNRPCSLYMVRSPFQESVSRETLSTADINYSEVASNLTPSMRSAFFPRFSPDGRFLVFCSAQAAVDSGAHCATNSLHRIDWLPNDPGSSFNIFDVVPVVQCPEDDCFPGLYCSSILSHPWLSDGSTMMLSSYWGSTQVILSIDILSCKISRVTPADCDHSWNILALDGDNILSVCSSPVDPPEIKYGYSLCLEQKHEGHAWHWLDINCTSLRYSEKVKGLLSSHKFRILKIPVCDGVTKGTQTFESIFISSDSQANGLQEQNQSSCNPLIVILHGGPHSVSLTSYSESWAFLASLGYNLLIVNYRGSLGFGEEALQSLPGSIGIQDVNDVLAALDYVIQMGLADKSRVAVFGGSHGGFLTTHLIGQAPDRFVAAAARNPVCNLALMVGTTDIPDWCFVETYGVEGKSFITEAPTSQNLDQFLSRSPIAHLPKVKAPTLILLGAQDLRVPISNGLQYARALKEKGSEVKVIVFPEDVHGIERPQSDFESFLNIGVWFRKYCK